MPGGVDIDRIAGGQCLLGDLDGCVVADVWREGRREHDARPYVLRSDLGGRDAAYGPNRVDLLASNPARLRYALRMRPSGVGRLPRTVGLPKVLSSPVPDMDPEADDGDDGEKTQARHVAAVTADMPVGVVRQCV